MWAAPEHSANHFGSHVLPSFLGVASKADLNLNHVELTVNGMSARAPAGNQQPGHRRLHQRPPAGVKKETEAGMDQSKAVRS